MCVCACVRARARARACVCVCVCVCLCLLEGEEVGGGGGGGGWRIVEAGKGRVRRIKHQQNNGRKERTLERTDQPRQRQTHRSAGSRAAARARQPHTAASSPASLGPRYLHWTTATHCAITTPLPTDFLQRWSLSRHWLHRHHSWALAGYSTVLLTTPRTLVIHTCIYHVSVLYLCNSAGVSLVFMYVCSSAGNSLVCSHVRSSVGISLVSVNACN